ncbi:MAG: hypothetical protein QOF76_1389 [Solirubrobacteraceae bacterium]|jgi:hypothetical protein|nr:hypothetical protein [Solirubrobacteraceae bacterium]
MRKFLVLVLLAVPATALADRAPNSSERAAIKAAAKSSSQTQGAGKFKVEHIRVSTVGPWARATLDPKSDSLDTAVAVFKAHGYGGYKLKELGTAQVGCDIVPKKVAADLSLGC